MKPNYLIHILTTDATMLNWRTFGEKLTAIKDELKHVANARFVFHISHTHLEPEVKDGRITHRYMDKVSRPFLEKGYHFVAIHMSDAQRQAWGIKPSVNGSFHSDYDAIQEFYFWADEGTKRGRYNQFVQTFLHELRHAIMQGIGKPDDTHERHAKGDIRGSFKGLSMAGFTPARRNLEKQVSLLTSIVSLLKRMIKPPTLLHPVQDKRRFVSQPYGVKNARYPRTGRHIGTDYPLPRKTPLYAPWDGTVTAVGTHPALGNYLHFAYEWQGQVYEERWAHLDELPDVGSRRRGDFLAYSGNTGDSDGPHLHREVWLDDVRVDLINRSNWSTLTIDPESIPTV